MIRNNLDVGIVTGVRYVRPESGTAICYVFNTETGLATVNAITSYDAESKHPIPRYVYILETPAVVVSEGRIKMEAADLGPLTPQEQRYLASALKKIEREQRAGYDAFGVNGLVGIFRSLVSSGLGRIFDGNKPHNAWPPALVQRKPETP